MAKLSPGTRRVLRTACWAVLTLIAVDVAVAALFPRPVDYSEALSSLDRYFDYGRSTEGKLKTFARILEREGEPPASLPRMSQDCSTPTSAPTPGKVGVTLYGNSFSLMLGSQLAARYSLFEPNYYFGSAAPLNHSFGCFEDRKDSLGPDEPIQVIGVLASSLRRMRTITGLTTSFERPHPFVYPRYELRADGTIVAYRPSIRSATDLWKALADPSQWSKFMNELADHDDFYSSFVMREDVLDSSPFFRLLRRGWGQSVMRSRTQALYSASGDFDPDYIGVVGPALLARFVDEVVRGGRLPVIVLFEDRGYAGVMSRTFRQIIDRKDVITIDVSQIVATTDGRNFISDGHYTHSAMDKVVDVLAKRLAEKGYADPAVR